MYVREKHDYCENESGFYVENGRIGLICKGIGLRGKKWSSGKMQRSARHSAAPFLASSHTSTANF
jgi:hypothetical protein